MAKLESIKASIRDLANRPNNVTSGEIAKLFNQLAQNGFVVSVRENVHAKLFTIEGMSVSICTHNRGQKQLKSAYVKRFLEVMIQLELYDKG